MCVERQGEGAGLARAQDQKAAAAILHRVPFTQLSTRKKRGQKTTNPVTVSRTLICSSRRWRPSVMEDAAVELASAPDSSGSGNVGSCTGSEVVAIISPVPERLWWREDDKPTVVYDNNQ